MATQDYEFPPPDPSRPGPAADRLDFYVPAELARGRWRCRLTNITEENSIITGRLQYVQWHAPLFTTRIPMRLLNHTLGQLITALGFQVFAHKGVGLLSVNEEIEHLTKGRIRDTEISFPDNPLFELENFALTDHYVRVDRDPATSQPRFMVGATFEGDIDLGIPGLIGFEVTKVDITISTVLYSSNPVIDRLGNRVVVFSAVTVGVDGTDEGLAEGYDISDLEGDIEEAVGAFIRKGDSDPLSRSISRPVSCSSPNGRTSYGTFLPTQETLSSDTFGTGDLWT
jgi:hypothetical protein